MLSKTNGYYVTTSQQQQNKKLNKKTLQLDCWYAWNWLPKYEGRSIPIFDQALS